MADDARKLSITYSSELIPPPETMRTLAVYYDEIWLPHPYDLDPKVLRLFNLSPFSTLFSYSDIARYSDITRL